MVPLADECLFKWSGATSLQRLRMEQVALAVC